VLNGDATLHAGQMLGVFGQHFGAGNFNPAQMATMALQQNGGMNAQDPKLEDGGEDTKKRKKRAYKARDPNAPKRPLTAYFRYLGEVRHSISEELQKNPENFKDVAGQPGDISRIATARWQQMSEEAKAPYKAAYRSELEDYNVKAAQYAKSKGLPVGDATELGDGDATGFTEADAPGEDVAEDVKAAAGKDDDDDDTSSEDSSSEDSDEDEPAPAPVKAPTPKKSAMKKNKTPAQPQTFNSLPTPVFNSINPNPPAASSSSSPTRKRKGSGEEAEGSKKRNRKSKGDAVAGSDPAPVAPMAASSPEVQAPAAEGKKKKKDKKKSKADA
jgi:transcriptional regulator HMO1